MGLLQSSERLPTSSMGTFREVHAKFWNRGIGATKNRGLLEDLGWKDSPQGGMDQ